MGPRGTRGTAWGAPRVGPRWMRGRVGGAPRTGPRGLRGRVWGAPHTYPGIWPGYGKNMAGYGSDMDTWRRRSEPEAPYSHRDKLFYRFSNSYKSIVIVTDLPTPFIAMPPTPHPSPLVPIEQKIYISVQSYYFLRPILNCSYDLRPGKTY